MKGFSNSDGIKEGMWKMFGKWRGYEIKEGEKSKLFKIYRVRGFLKSEQIKLFKKYMVSEFFKKEKIIFYKKYRVPQNLVSLKYIFYKKYRMKNSNENKNHCCLYKIYNVEGFIDENSEIEFSRFNA